MSKQWRSRAGARWCGGGGGGAGGCGWGGGELVVASCEGGGLAGSILGGGGGKEGIVLFNDALNTFYLWFYYGVRHNGKGPLI